MRIISGKYRRRRLLCPKGDITRPTLDRVRESLFSILGNLEGDRVVDLYAGTGALGLEAASRGAAAVTLVEADRGVAEVIRKNVASLGAEGVCEVVQCAVEKCRGPLTARAPFDLVLADPPWRISGEALVVVPEITRGLLAPGATVVIGHASREDLRPAEDSELQLSDCRRWGDSALSFFRQHE